MGLLANSQEMFVLLQKGVEGIQGEKINFVETRFSAHKQTQNGQLCKKLKLQSHNRESQGLLVLMVW